MDKLRRVQVLAPLRHLLDFCYPRTCAVCDGAGDSASQICTACEDELRALEAAPACDRCAMPLADLGAACPYCAGNGVRPFERIVRLGTFSDPIRHLLHQTKYHGRWTLAEFLADRLLAREPAKALLSETDVIAPIPLHPFRQMSRGYNQAQVIAKRLAGQCRIRLVHPLVRLKNTDAQTHLHSREKRMENLRDAFGLLRPRCVKGRHVVLVDDVMTTGATLHAAAVALKEANPASISAIVIAIADPRRRGFETI